MPCTEGGAPVTIERLFGFVKLGTTQSPSSEAPCSQARFRNGATPACTAVNREHDVLRTLVVAGRLFTVTNKGLHAYDLDTLGGHGFRIRLATDGEIRARIDGLAFSIS